MNDRYFGGNCREARWNRGRHFSELFFLSKSDHPWDSGTAFPAQEDVPWKFLRVTEPASNHSAMRNHVQLEPGNSSRVAMYNTELKTFRILDLDTRAIIVTLDIKASEAAW